MAFSEAKIQNLFDINLTTGAVQSPPVFETSDIVYLRTDVNVANTDKKRRPYTVVEMHLVGDGSAGFLDANGAAADGTAAESVATDGQDGVNDDTAPAWGFFYKITPSGFAGDTFIKHETELLDLAGVNFIADANDWT